MPALLNACASGISASDELHSATEIGADNARSMDGTRSPRALHASTPAPDRVSAASASFFPIRGSSPRWTQQRATAKALHAVAADDDAGAIGGSSAADQRTQFFRHAGLAERCGQALRTRHGLAPAVGAAKRRTDG